MTEQELTIVRACVPCCEKLTSFYDYYTSVIYNQSKLSSIGLKTAVVTTPQILNWPQIKPEVEISVKTEKMIIDNVTANHDTTLDDYLENNLNEEDSSSTPHPVIDKIATKEKIVPTSKVNSVRDLINNYIVHICTECKKQRKFDTYSALQEHNRRKHNRDVQLRCCDRTFIRQYDFAHHLIKIHKAKRETIIIDERCLIIKDRRQIDEERDELIKRFFIMKCLKCPEESKHFSNLSALQAHSKDLHGKVLNILCCGRKFSYRSELADHLTNLHTIPKQPKLYEIIDDYRCDKCFEEFREYRLLQSHKILQHESVCQYCNVDLRKFVSKTKKLRQIDITSHLQQHLLSPDISKPAPFVCAHCPGREIADREKLKYHMERWHHNIRNVSFICEHCGDGFKFMALYTAHLKSKHPPGQMKVPCKLCGVMIRNNDRAMQMHFTNIHNPTPTQCTVCGIISKSKKSAIQHFIRNHKERKFRCMQCDKKFMSKDRLKEHEATHLGINLYYCTLCEARYKNKSNFAMHKRRNHPVEYAKEKAEREARKYQAE